VALINALCSDRPETPFSKTVVSDSEIVLPVVTPTTEALAAMKTKITTVSPTYDARIHRLILINPNSSELLPQRRWPSENYRQLIVQIIERYPDCLLLITGAPSELPGAMAMVNAVNHKRCANLAGLLRIGELPTLYTLSALLVTNDSGPGHFSAITKMPTIILFGPETPKLYGSLGNAYPITADLACSPCVSATNHRKTPCTDDVCLQSITTATVFAKVEEILSPTRAIEKAAVVLRL
jgi:ADP-heptose:LPS heptosyltransferase